MNTAIFAKQSTIRTSFTEVKKLKKEIDNA